MKEHIMKKLFVFLSVIFFVAAILTLSACPPGDGFDFEPTDNNTNNGEGDSDTVYETVKTITFDDLNNFTDWSGGGGAGSTHVTLSTEKNHGEGAGKSLMFSDRTEKYYRIKFTNIFAPDDIGLKFNITMWVYTDTATTVQLGLFGGGNYTSNPLETKPYEITAGWNKLEWKAYTHTETDITQIGFEQPNSGSVTLVNPLYIDDILIEKEDREGTGDE
jgi:hypothetical protein